MQTQLLTSSLLIVSSQVIAQCTTQWTAGDGIAGVDGARCAAYWDPDGTGPAPAQLAVGGAFATAGGNPAANIAMRNPATGIWQPLGSGTDNIVNRMVVLPSGQLIAAGAFQSAGGNPAGQIASWDGVSWSPLGAGPGGEVADLAVTPNGELVAVGTLAASTDSFVTVWNGSAWNQIPTPIAPTAEPRSVAALANGDLVVGTRTPFGSTTPARVLRWNGSTWALVASFSASSPFDYRSVNALAADAAGGLIVGGKLGAPGACLALESQGFAIMPGSPSGVVYTLLAESSGSTLIGGDFGISAAPVHRYSGSFTALGSITGLARELLPTPSGDLLTIGDLQKAGPTSAAMWDGATWQSVDPITALDRPVRALAALPGEQLVAAGDFTVAGGTAANGVALHDGTAWQPLGAGLGSSPWQTVHALAARSGDVIAGGNFTLGNQGGVARWDGSAWLPLAPGLGSGNVSVHALAVLAGGDVVAGGKFVNAGGVGADHLARWDGVAWWPLGSGITAASSSLRTPVQAIAALPNGDLVVGGVFVDAGGANANNIARWDGTSWHAMGSGIAGAVHALTALPSGDLIAAGWFTSAGGVPANSIARWNGSSWSALGSGIRNWSQPGEVFATEVLPNGDIVAAGDFNSAGIVPARNAARWDGSAWSPVASSLTSPAGSPTVHALAWRDAGELVAGGAFLGIDGVTSHYLARLKTTCPAQGVTQGAPCLGGAGALSLTVRDPAWVGATFRAEAAVLAMPSIAISVFGLQATSLPMATLLPQGVAGCDLIVSPDLLAAAVPIAGTIMTSLPLPASPGLAGIAFHHQVAVLELDATGNIMALTGTNALQLAIGSF